MRDSPKRGPNDTSGGASAISKGARSAPGGCTGYFLSRAGRVTGAQDTSARARDTPSDALDAFCKCTGYIRKVQRILPEVRRMLPPLHGRCAKDAQRHTRYLQRCTGYFPKHAGCSRYFQRCTGYPGSSHDTSEQARAILPEEVPRILPEAHEVHTILPQARRVLPMLPGVHGVSRKFT